MSAANSTRPPRPLPFPSPPPQLFIVNAPAIFSVIWAFVRPLLAPRTQQKIVVLRDNGNATLLRHIAPDQLPVKYGGTSTRDIADFFGPWEDLLGPQSWTTLRDPADPPPPRLDKYLKSLRLTKPLESTGEGLLLMTTEAPEVAPEGWSGWLWGWVG